MSKVVLLALFLSLIFFKPVYSAEEISADSYLVVNINNDSVYSEKNTNKAYSIASVTKLMSAVITTENLKLNKTITITKNMLKPAGHSPSIFLNLKVSAENLLKISLIQSTNDAAESLSYSVGNKKFIKLMNKKAKEIGMKNTVFYDVHGLDPRNKSTAKDLLKLAEYIDTKHHDLWAITKKDDLWLPDPTGKMLKFKNMNIFYDDPSFIGGKTGYIKESKHTLVSLFDIGGETVAIIVLKSANSRKDVNEILDSLKNKFAMGV